MKHLTRIALGSALLLALAAAGASPAAAALPEFVPGTPPGFESALLETQLETVGKTTITCKRGGDGGQVTGPKTLTVRINLLECSIPGAPCTSAGAAPGEIESAVLTGTLGYIKAAKKDVGLDLTSPTAPILAFMCGATPVVVEGSVIGKLKPVDKPVLPGKHVTLKFAEKAGKQKPTHFEGGPADVLETSINGAPFEQSGLVGSDELLFVAPLEIRA